MPSTKCITPPFRATYVRVYEPAQEQNGDMAYSIQMIFPQDADLKEMKACANEAMAKKFGQDKSAWPKGSQVHNPFRSGNDDRDPETQPEYKDSIFMKAKTKNQPGLVDENVQPIMDQDAFYSGCYARASVSFYAFDKAGNKGVGLALNNVMKIKDGDRLDGRMAAEDEFASYGGGGGSPSDADSGFGDSTSDNDLDDDIPF